MTIADQLGTGASFGNVRRGSGRSARGRAKAVAQGDVPAYELVRLPLDSVAPTPLNPRRNFGSDEDKTRFGEELRHAQLAACVVVSTPAYLELWPEQREELGDATHVLVNGERRYRSAVHVGLEALDFVVRDDLADSKEDFVNHLLKENLEREDFDVIERARGVQQLVEVCDEGDSGAQTRAAAKLGRGRSWVTNQLALLRLPAEIQTMLSAGELAERDGRQIARYSKRYPELPAPELLRHWKAFKAAEAKEREREKAILQAAKDPRSAASEPDVLSADNKPDASSASDPADDVDPADADGSRAADNPRGAASPLPSTPHAPKARKSAKDSPAGKGSPAPKDSPATKDSPAGKTTPPAGAVPRQGDSPSAAAPSPTSDRVRQLGETPAEQAEALAAGMGRSELLALIEELHTYV